MGRHIFLRDAIAAHGDGSEEDAPCAVRGGAGGVAAVDLLNEIGNALDRLPGGDVFLQNFQTGLLVILKAHLAGLAGSERYGLLRIAHNVRLGNGFLPHHIDACRKCRKRCRTVRAGGDGGRIAAGNGLNGQHRAGDRRAGLRIGLDDLHIRLFIVDRRNGVFAVTLSYIYVHALRRGIDAEAVRCGGLDKTPKAGGGILNIDLALRIGDIAADDLPVEIDAETCTGKTGCGPTGSLFQHDLARAARRLLRLVRRWLARYELVRAVVVEKRLIFAVAGDRIHRPSCTLILHDGCGNALRSVFLDLALELGILSCFLCKEGVDEAQIQIIGVGVGIAARVAVSTGLAFISLILPNVGLYGHKKLADV